MSRPFRTLSSISLDPTQTGTRLLPFGRDPIPVCVGLLRFSLSGAVEKTVKYIISLIWVHVLCGACGEAAHSLDGIP